MEGSDASKMESLTALSFVAEIVAVAPMIPAALFPMLFMQADEEQEEPATTDALAARKEGAAAAAAVLLLLADAR